MFFTAYTTLVGFLIGLFLPDAVAVLLIDGIGLSFVAIIGPTGLVPEKLFS